MITRIIPLLTAVLLGASSSLSLADERYRPVEDPLVQKACGECHMAFQPQMLPAKSWTKIMGELNNHFGEDATIAQDKVAQVSGYLTKNAADSGWLGGRFMRGLTRNDAPPRITETPHWLHEHEKEVPKWAWSDPNVKSKANCVACHPRANRGDYDDD